MDRLTIWIWLLYIVYMCWNNTLYLLIKVYNYYLLIWKKKKAKWPAEEKQWKKATESNFENPKLLGLCDSETNIPDDTSLTLQESFDSHCHAHCPHSVYLSWSRYHLQQEVLADKGKSHVSPLLPSVGPPCNTQSPGRPQVKHQQQCLDPYWLLHLLANKKRNL